MQLFLRYLARGGYYHQVGRDERLAESSAMVNLHKTTAFFQHTAARHKPPIEYIISVYRLHIYRAPRK